MKILHVVHGYYPESRGGTETYVKTLIESQVKLGLEPLLLHGSFEPREVHRLEAVAPPGVPTWRLHRSDPYADFWDQAHSEAAGGLLRELLRRERPDLVHVHQWIRLTDDLVAVCEDEFVPTLVSLHDLYSSCPACFRQRPDDSHCERSLCFDSCHDCVPLRGVETEQEVRTGIELYRANFRHELQRARRVIAATAVTARLVTQGLGLPAELVHILGLGYERKFRQCPAYRLPPPGQPLRLAYWGVLTQRKGTQVLLAALRALDGRRRALGPALGEELELHLFGRVDTDRLDRQLRRLAEGLPVEFRGRYEYEELAALAPQLAVFPSTCFETYGFVLDEAFELGVPVLVTDIGALGERSQGAGWTVRPGDSSALAELLGRILDDPGLLIEKQREIPPLSPGMAEHAEFLLAHYQAAIATAPRNAEPVSRELRERYARLRQEHETESAPLDRGLRRIPGDGK
ncbi:MAG: glycosyltransferase [Planctomycetota bacterium]